MVIGQKVLQSANSQDELLQIFRVFGTPTEETWPGLTDMCTRGIHNLPHYEPMDLRQKFPGLEPDDLDLLSKMLFLDPTRRISAKDALNHPYFNDLDLLNWQSACHTLITLLFLYGS